MAGCELVGVDDWREQVGCLEAQIQPWTPDEDEDGWGGEGVPINACSAPEGYGEQGDCDDADIERNPSTVEICDGVDNDCDNSIDEEGIPVSWYPDEDLDGYGDTDAAAVTCRPPAGYLSMGGDCDDADPTVNPGAAESCNAYDDDCDGEIDEADATDAPTWYADADGDGFGVEGETAAACNAPVGYAAVAGDCDDEEGSVTPGASEICKDGLVNDCGGTEEEASDSCSAWRGTAAVGDADAWLEGSLDGDEVGWAVAGAGDFNGDGLADVVVGAPHRDHDASYYPSALYLVLGKTSLSGLLTADASYKSAKEDEWVGYSVSGAGDVNADGYADVLVGVPHYDDGLTDKGAAYLVLGAASVSAEMFIDTMLVGEGAAGTSVSGLGDVDDDGYDDVLVGDPSYVSASYTVGGAYVAFGTASISESFSVGAVLGGESIGAAAGLSVAGCGDVDADGYADGLVGAPHADLAGSMSGAVYVILGASSIGTVLTADARFLGESYEERAGYSVSGAGDMNADGYDDIAIGAPWRDMDGYADDKGAVYLLLGGSSIALTLGSDATLSDGQAQGYFGISVASARDLDRDGYDDLLVGAPGFGGSDSGRSFVTFGTATLEGVLASEGALYGESELMHVGWSVAGAGDTNLDGYPDLLIGAPADEDVGPGAAYLFHTPHF